MPRLINRRLSLSEMLLYRNNFLSALLLFRTAKWGAAIPRQLFGGSKQYGTSSRPTPEEVRAKAMRDRFLRVDHAGELGADRIYAGQMAVLGKFC